MNKGLIVAFSTLIGFAAGTFAGAWMQRTQPVPAPPTSVLGELRDLPITASAPENPDAPIPSGRPLPEEALRQMVAEIEAFKQKIDPIKTEFRKELEALLTPVQRERLKAMSERPPPPGPPGTIDPARDRNYRAYGGMDSTITLVVIPFALARLNEELGLTFAQREAVYHLLLQRREKFLALVDNTPPPSFNLDKLAPADPKKL